MRIAGRVPGARVLVRHLLVASVTLTLTSAPRGGAAQDASQQGAGTAPPAESLVPDVSGTYETNYNDLHLEQRGTSVTGCYEYNEGVLSGTIDGRKLRLTWREGPISGGATMELSPDGAELAGTWWTEGVEPRRSGSWTGKRKSRAVGACQHRPGPKPGRKPPLVAPGGTWVEALDRAAPRPSDHVLKVRAAFRDRWRTATG